MGNEQDGETSPQSGVSHLTTTRVALQDVLEHLGASSCTASSFGSQLERARDGTAGAIDYVRARDRAEVRILASAAIIRCVDALAEAQLNRTGESCVDIRKFAVKIRMAEGATVIAVLRAYQPWATSWPEHGLAEVYAWMRSRNPSLKEADPGGETSIAQAFRVGKAKRARTIAAAVLADAEVAVHAWVEQWNGRTPKRRKEADHDVNDAA